MGLLTRVSVPKLRLQHLTARLVHAAARCGGGCRGATFNGLRARVSLLEDLGAIVGADERQRNERREEGESSNGHFDSVTGELLLTLVLRKIDERARRQTTPY
jgi:hypothetical protein